MEIRLPTYLMIPPKTRMLADSWGDPFRTGGPTLPRTGRLMSRPISPLLSEPWLFSSSPGRSYSAEENWQASARSQDKPCFFLTLSGLATGLSWVCYFQAFQSGLASSVSTLDKTSLVMTLTLANDLPGELMLAKAMIGIALIVAGTVVLVR